MKKLVLFLSIVVFASCNAKHGTTQSSDAFRFPDDNNVRDWLYGNVYSDSVDYPFSIQDGLIAVDEAGIGGNDTLSWMVNLYNSSIIRGSMRSKCEDVYLFETADDYQGFTVTENIISDAHLRSVAQSYIDSCCAFINNPETATFDPPKGEQDFYKEQALYYQSHQYGQPLTFDEFFQIHDMTQWVSDYDDLRKMSFGDEDEIKKLKKRLDNATDYTERALLACQYVRCTSDNVGILTALMEESVYSVYLFDIWEYWRCAYQDYYGGASIYSDIYNELYNYMRKHLALIVLEQMKQHPEDKYAKAQFSNLYETENYSRFEYTQEGTQVPGNSVLVKQFMLNWYGDADDE